MIRWCLFAMTCLLTTITVRAADLEAGRIDAVTKRPTLRRAVWGILVEDATGKVLYERNADTLMTPASVRKLFTSASVLACYGMDGTLETKVAVRGVQTGRVLRGDLVVGGGGDPSLGGRWEYDSDRNGRLHSIAEALGRLGIDRIEGDVVVDVSAFDDVLIPGSWKTDNLGNSWAPPIDAIAYNENVIGVRVVGRKPASAVVSLDPEFATFSMQEPCVRSRHVVGMSDGNVVTVGCARDGSGTLSYLLSVDDAARFAGDAIRSFLQENGIAVAGVRTTRESVTDARPLLSITSPPTAMLLDAVLGDSANLYAEMLLKSMSSGSLPASFETSLQIERAYLERVVGLDAGEFSFDDGSGLSPEDAVTPRATVRLLRHFDGDAASSFLVRGAVATPGKGTLRKRLEGLEGRVLAKTGSIDGVNALAGWVLGETGSVRRFAIFINHHTTSGKTAADAIDEIVRVIAGF